MSISVVKTLEELDAGGFGCCEEPESGDWCVGAELFGVKSKAGVFDPGEEWGVLAAPAVFVVTWFFAFGEDAEKAKIIGNSVADLLAPGVAFGEVEFEAGGGVVGGDFAGVADEVAEEVGEGFFL